MKTVMQITVVLAAMAVTVGCSKNLPDGNSPSGGGTEIIDEPLEDLPPLEDVDDVCEKMTDIGFMSYCYRNFDANMDGKVSMTEANAVWAIECDDAENFSGIEYFSKLVIFKSSSVRTIDLRYNKRLMSVDCKGAPIAAVDLRYNTGLQEMSFEDCANFVKVLLPSGLDSISSGAFRNTAIRRFVCPDSVKTIGESAFRNCDSLESVTFPDGLTWIGSSAFYGCNSLDSIAFPCNIMAIGEYAFGYCGSLKTITFKGTFLSEIEKGTFAGCAFESFTCPDNITKIGEGAFKSCYHLKTITFPDGLTWIGSSVFVQCGLAEVVCYALDPPSCGVNAFVDFGGVDIPKLYVPSSSVFAYENAYGWGSAFKQILPIE